MAEEDEITSFYDDELPLLQKAGLKVAAIKHMLDIDAFSRAMVEAYAEAGFNITVTFNVSDAGFLPLVTVVSRTSGNPHYEEIKKDGFDHDRKRWEVQTDMLNDGKNAGAITNDGRIIAPSKSTAFFDKKG